MKRKRNFNPRMLFATLTALLLAAGGIFSASTTAVAASEEIVVDQEFIFDGVQGASLGTSGSKFAQPFIPSNSGTLDSITLSVWTTGEYEFDDVSIHTISADNVISVDPIPGGIGVTSFTIWPNNPDVATATATFNSRPQLSAAQRYVLIVDPSSTKDPSAYGASFPMVFGGNSDYALRVQTEDAWGPFWITGHIYFSIRFAVPLPDIEVVPQEPTVIPAPACGVRGSIKLPTQDGVKFVQVDNADKATITATPEDGYTFPANVAATWILDVSPIICPPEIATVTPEAPHVTKATCEVPGSISTVEKLGITYTVSGSLFHSTVTATAQHGYKFPAEAKTQWTYDLSKLKCGTTDPAKPKTPATNALANTGSESPLNAGLIGAVFACTGAFMISFMAIRRSRASTK